LSRKKLKKFLLTSLFLGERKRDIMPPLDQPPLEGI